MAELKEITEISLKLRDEEINYLVSAKQGDRATRYVYAKIQNDDGTEYTIPDNCIAIVNIKKPDKHFCYNECKIENNRVIIELTKQALAAAGTAHADIELRNEQNALILSTQSFGIEIEQSMRNENAILSSNEMTALEKKVQKYIDDLIETKKEALEVAEAVRIAEEARKQAESSRATEESQRQTAESNRQANETERQQAEDGRQANETERQQAEDGRQANETERQQAEDGRQAKEAARQQAEDDRQAKEAARQQTEDGRQAKEAARQQTEDDRQAKETARQQAENDRQEKETARKTAETQREQLFKEYKTVMNDNTDVAKNSASSAKSSEDSAKKYYEQAKEISETLSGALRPMGTVTFANLPVLSEVAGGSMYNISDQFVTTSDFKEGEGDAIPAGANVYKTEDGKWDILAGTPVTGVKGSAESEYRRGNVDITAEKVGALSLKNGGNVTGDTSFQGKRRVHYVDDGTGRAGYDKIARFTANSAYNNAAIEIELARRTDTVPTCVAIMFAGNACYAVTCMGHTKDIYMCKESDGVWLLCVRKTHEWCTTSVLDYVHSSFADGVNVEWINSSNQSYLDSLPGTEIISGTWGYIVKEAIEAGNVNWNGVTDKPSTYPPADGSNNYVKVFNSSNVNSSDDLTVNDLADQGFAAAMIAATEDSPIGSGWFHVLNLGWDNSKNNWVSQIALGTQPNDGLYYRTTGASIAGKPWKRVLDSSNYTNYALKNENLSDIDLNNVTTTGIYHLTGNLVNNPESCNATLIVDFNVGTPYQLFIPDYNYRMYKRVKSNGNWSSWTSLFTWNNLEGKPVARKIDIVSNSTFTINNYSDNPVSIVQTVDCGEYITMGNMNMRHYKLLLCTKDECKNGIVTEFDITKNNKTLVPVTSANPAQIISSNKNINLYFDIHFNYSENFGGWKWSWDEEGYITIWGGSGTAGFSTKNFFWVDCWAQ